MFESLLTDLKHALPALTVLSDAPMAEHCSFRIGGPAGALALPHSAEELTALCQFLHQKGVEPFIMGNGTNLLVTDGRFDRFVLKCCDGVGAVRVEGDTVTADCGATLAHVASVALDHDLTGLEFAHGIPGSIGGAVSMNAGAYGGEMKDVVFRTEYLNADGRPQAVEGEAHDFAYRHSVFSDRDCLVLRTSMKLSPGKHEDIAARMRELGAKRRASQPLDMPSAGSTFKRPVGGYAAALIDEAELKGFRIGGAQVSEKHAGFVVNAGGASFDDVLRLMEHIQKTVYERSGIELTPEVKIIR